MTRDDAVKIVGYLNAAYPTNKLDDAAAGVFINFIGPLDFESCRWAVKKWIQNEKWFPSISELTDVTRQEMQRRGTERPALPEGGRFLSREENKARLKQIQDQIAASTGPLFSSRTRQAGLGREPGASPPGVQPAPPAPRSRPSRGSTESS